MSEVLLAGMLIHLILSANYVVPAARTRNPIWGELRSMLVLVVILILWGEMARPFNLPLPQLSPYVPQWHEVYYIA